MELKWLEDIIALAEAGNLTQAAKRRNISQPAFSRRINVIEQWLGAPVLIRDTQPARGSPAISSHIESIRAMSRDMRRLKNDFQVWDQTQRRLVIATQHTLSITYFPKFIKTLQSINPRPTIELRSGNRDESFAILMTGQASMLVAYETPDFPLAIGQSLLEKKLLLTDTVIPVASNSYAATLLGPEPHADLSVIGYPRDVFFGQILSAHVFPKLLNEGRVLTTICEAALVPAVMQMAIAGIGIAWLPRSIVNEIDLENRLVDLSQQLPSYDIEIIAARLKTPRPALAELMWQKLTAQTDSRK